MRIPAEQLPKHLQRPELLPVYYVSGNEPLQLLEAIDQLRRRARELGYDERAVLDMENGDDWSRLPEMGANLSLFSEKRIIEVRLGGKKPGKEGSAALGDYLDGELAGNLLLLSSEQIDKQAQQTKWFKALDKHGGWTQVWPLRPAQLPGWIADRCRRQRKRIDPEAAALIAQRVEGNLPAAQQEIDKLALLVEAEEINSNDVLGMVVDNARFDVFEMVDNAFLGKPGQTARMLRGLKREGVEALAVQGALMWSLRRAIAIACEVARGRAREQAFRDYRIRPQNQAGLNALLRRFEPRRLGALLPAALAVDKALKGGGVMDGWQALEKFMLAVAGRGRAPA